MKYLSDYTQDRQTKVFNDAGAFFAFGNDQFNKQKVDGVQYVHLGSGLICPKGRGGIIMDSLDLIHKESMDQDIKENGKDGIIKRELANHEAYYTGDIDQTFDALEGYNITRDEILDVFNVERLLDNNY